MSSFTWLAGIALVAIFLWSSLRRSPWSAPVIWSAGERSSLVLALGIGLVAIFLLSILFSPMYPSLALLLGAAVFAGIFWVGLVLIVVGLVWRALTGPGSRNRP